MDNPPNTDSFHSEPYAWSVVALLCIGGMISMLDRQVLILLVDHDVFKSVPLAERAEKQVYDTRGVWPDQPRAVLVSDEGELRKAG